MLDVSIPKISKTITSNAGAKEFCNQYVKIEEKLDGTKLTLIRNDKPFNKNNYLDNWIISYKEGVVFPEEFTGIDIAKRKDEIEKQSAGRSQYAFVHKHLKRVHPNTANFPNDYEFFIEFIQRKPTISRSYEKTGGLFLTGFGPTTYSLRGARITSLADFENDEQKKEFFRRALELQAYPAIFEGRLDSSTNIIAGITVPAIKSAFEAKRKEIDTRISSNDWKGVLEIIVNVYSDFTSSLGGDAEGVVVAPIADPQTGQTTKFTGRLFKTSRVDQHDQEMRKIKKQTEFGIGSAEEESIYNSNLSSFFVEKIKENDLDDETISTAISFLSKLVYGMSLSDFAKIGVVNPRKKLINIQDDAIEIARGIFSRRYAAASNRKKTKTTVGIIPMAVKPIHKGHWQVIKQAANENDKVFLVVSAKDRGAKGEYEISGNDMIRVWKKFLEPILPPNVDISYSASPLVDAKGAAKIYTSDEDVFIRLYAGEDDKDRFTEEDLLRYYPVQYPAGRIEPVFVKNVQLPGEDARISGTYMRQLLSAGAKERFKSLLPDELQANEKESIWNMFYKQPVAERLIRTLVRAYLIT